MTDYKFISRLFLVFILICLTLSSASAESFYAKVVGVTDGDTITVLYEKTPIKIRLYGIDCPETHQDFGYRAKQRTSELVFGEVVTVVPKVIDYYGRTVAKIFNVNGENVSQKLVREGLCWWYVKYSPHDTELRKLQELARAEKLGIWSMDDVVPPWEFRARGRAK